MKEQPHPRWRPPPRSAVSASFSRGNVSKSHPGPLARFVRSARA